ncbi:MAG: cysteine synthase A [Deltaproteobacteria bacterium]|jgi:cysteine synthase A|nr:cysteine synthase A [Deltaproteobacteria bacterium]
MVRPDEPIEFPAPGRPVPFLAARREPGAPRDHPGVAGLIGGTPLAELAKFAASHRAGARLLAKLEFFNPLSSVKDRIGLAMVEAAERGGRLAPGGVIVEPSSGNTGVALAFVAAARGYRLVVTMPESMSVERRSILKALGAQVVLTPASDGMRGAVRKAEEIGAQIPGSFLPQQFKNPANPRVHRETTGPEIWGGSAGEVDVLVCGVGTGGTVTGAGEYLKGAKPSVKIVAVEPDSSPVLSGGAPGPHKIQGIGAGFVPDVLNLEILDEIFRVKDLEACDTARELARTEGLFVGVSAGAAVFAATALARRAENRGRTIVAVVPDSGERYLSTALFDNPDYKT